VIIPPASVGTSPLLTAVVFRAIDRPTSEPGQICHAEDIITRTTLSQPDQPAFRFLVLRKKLRVYLHPLTRSARGPAVVIYSTSFRSNVLHSMMVFSTTRVATVLGLLLPSVTSFAVPAERFAPRVPEVPWKENGLWSGHKRRDSYNTSCNHGPQSRGCWSGGYSIDTDMDLQWPTTGKTVKYHLTISNATGAPDGFQRQMFLINGQYPGPVCTHPSIQLRIC
jgi:hypothetical protein